MDRLQRPHLKGFLFALQVLVRNCMLAGKQKQKDLKIIFKLTCADTASVLR